MSEPQQIATLDKEIAALQAKREALLSKSRQETLDSTIANIAIYKFTAAELGITATSTKRKAKGTSANKMPPKYANPADKSITWSGGKGPKPKWVKEHLDAGKSLDELLIK